MCGKPWGLVKFSANGKGPMWKTAVIPRLSHKVFHRDSATDSLPYALARSCLRTSSTLARKSGSPPQRAFTRLIE